MNLDRLFKKKDYPFDLYEVDLSSASDEELQGISDKMGIALALPEMKRIRDYFQNKKGNPTDVELEALGQAWSEHCCYKSSKIPLKNMFLELKKKKLLPVKMQELLSLTKITIIVPLLNHIIIHQQ